MSEDHPSDDRGQRRPYIDAPGTSKGALPIALGAGAVAVWCALALQRPTTTYHFAPLVVALVVPAAGRLRAGAPLSRPVALRLAGVGLALAIAGIGILLSSDALRGPTLFGSRNATRESFASAGLGALVGVRVALRRRSGWLLRDR